MKLTAYEHESLFQELQPEWNELLIRSTADRVFSTWEWQSTWWQAYHPGELWVIVCRNEAEQLIGLAPWFIEKHPVHGRVVRSIGCVEVTDYLDVIIDKAYVEPVMTCLAAFAWQHHNGFDVIDLCNLPETSPGYLRFPEILRQHNFYVTVKQQEVCPVIELPENWEDYLALLDKKQRHELRRKLRRAESESVEIGWYIVNKSHNLSDETARFLELMAASQYEKAFFLKDQQNVNFFKQIAPLMFEKGWLQLSFLTINGKAVATYLNFVYKERVLVYNSGLLPNEYSHLSAGIVLLAHNIQYAIEHGYRIFDFLRGNETYKYRMGGKDTQVFMLRAEPLTETA